MWGMLDTGGGIRAQLAEDNKVGNCGREWHVGFSLMAWGAILIRMLQNNA